MIVINNHLGVDYMQKYIIGGYTKGDNDGIHMLYFDENSIKFIGTKKLKKMNYPTYLEYNESEKLLFSIDKDYKGDGGISVFKLIDDELIYIDRLIDSEIAGCHIYYDPILSDIYVSQYHLGKLDVYSFIENHLERKATIIREGSSIRPEQTQSRPHSVLRLGSYIYVCDLGTDQLAVYDLDYNLVEELNFEPGTGPRHLYYSKKHHQFYVIGELNNTLNVIKINDNKHKLAIKEIHMLVESKDQEKAHSAAIKVTQDEKFIYTSTRFHNLINVFHTDSYGNLQKIQQIYSDGENPRDFTLDADEKYLIVPNMDSDSISMFERDTEKGTLKVLHNKYIAPECSRIILV